MEKDPNEFIRRKKKEKSQIKIKQIFKITLVLITLIFVYFLFELNH